MNSSIQNQPFTGAYSIKVNLAGYKQGDRVYLPDTPVLQDKFITAISVFGVLNSGSDTIQDPDGDIISSVNFDNLYLTLTDKGTNEYLSKVPLTYFVYGNRQIDINRYVFLPNCYLTVGNSSAAQNCVLLTFFYRNPSKQVVYPETNGNIQSLEVPVFISDYNRFYLPDNRILADKKIRNIYSTGQETFGEDNALTPNGTPVVKSSNAFLTAIYQNEIVLYRLPVYYLAQWYTIFELIMDNIQIDLPTSYIELSKNISSTVGDKCVYLNFEYDED